MTTPDALDKLDKAILRCLQKNGRETYDVIGAAIGLSPSAVLRRVKRLEEAGVIDRYVALVKPEAVGLGLIAYLNVRLEKHTESHKRNPMDVFRASVQTWPEVVECSSLTGEMDYLLRVVVSATVEDLCSGTCAAALDSRFEMVAVGADGRPVALATSTPDTPQTATPATTN